MTMNCEFSCALGRPLPLVVDGNYALSEAAAFEHIFKSCSCLLSHAEKMLYAYMESRLIHGLKYLKFLLSRMRSNGGDVYGEWSVSEIFYVSELKSLQYMFDRSHHANMNQQEVINDIVDCYEYVESLMSSCLCIIPPGLVPTMSTKFPSLLEAVLFGHIAGTLYLHKTYHWSIIPIISSCLFLLCVDALCMNELTDKITSRKKLMEFFEKVCQSYFSVNGCNDRIIWENSILEGKNALPLKEIMSKCQGEWHDPYLNRMEILDKKLFLGSLVTKWTKITLDFSITAPQWYYNTMRYFGFPLGADPNTGDSSDTAATSASASASGSSSSSSGSECRTVIRTDNVFNFFNTKEVEKESSVTVGLGGMVFSGFVIGGFATYGGLATYAVFVLARRRFHNYDDGLGF